MYYSEDIVTVPVAMIDGKCEIRKKNNLPTLELPLIMDHIFFCEYSYNPQTGSLKQVLPDLFTKLTA